MSCRNIYFVVFPDVHLLDLSGPLQVFSTANELMEKSRHSAVYQLHVVASEAGMLQTATALPIMAEPLPGGDVVIDTLIVAGGPGIHAALSDQTLVAWLKKRAAQAHRVVSICSGAFLLAACGMLDGRRAVTHWSVCEELAHKYPQVTVETNPIYIQDGPIWTSAGVTAGIDLALALIGSDLGHPLALEVAQNLVVFLKRSGGQAQFSKVLTFQRESERFSDLHAWIVANLTSDLSVSVLAAFSCMSERSFVRHYRKQTGFTPAKAVEQLRLESVRSLLLETELPVKRIAERCGFSSETTLRRCFIKHYGNSPSEYRHNFS